MITFRSSKSHRRCALRLSKLSDRWFGVQFEVLARWIEPEDPRFGGVVVTRILGWLLTVAALFGCAVAGVDPGSISGSVTNSSGIAQMGAVVEMYAVSTGQRVFAYTDAVGHF